MNLLESPKRLYLGNEYIELIASSLDDVTTAQAETYRVLLLMCQLGVTHASPKVISDYLQLKSPAPLWSRIGHLEQAGKLRRHITQAA